MFMFTLLGQDQRADTVEAPLGRLYEHVEGLVGGDARLIAAALLGLILLNATVVCANNVIQAVILRAHPGRKQMWPWPYFGHGEKE